MAACVEDDDAPAGEALQLRDHPLEIEAVGFGVIVGIGFDVEAGRLEERAVILPARVADPEGRLREVPLQEIRADLQGARPARSLYRHRPPLGDQRRIGPEQELLDLCVIGGDADLGKVILGVLSGVPALLRIADDVEHRDFPAAVLVNSHAQIDLLRIGVGVERFGQAKDRVGRRQGDFVKRGVRGSHSDLSL